MINSLIENIVDYDKIAEEAVRDIDVNAAGSCMKASEEITKTFLANSIDDFEVVEGWLSFNDGDYIPQHTWIELKDGTKIDKTVGQFDTRYWKLSTLEYYEDSTYKTKKYTPKEYLALCIKYPVVYKNGEYT